ncbi:cyclic nucleotide-binding domain-containing protein 2-like isoform X1 [Lithobates pipiens]
MQHQQTYIVREERPPTFRKVRQLKSAPAAGGASNRSLRDAVLQVTNLQVATRCFIHAAEEARGSSFWGDVEVSGGFNSPDSAFEEEKTGKKKKKKLALAFDTSFFKSQYEFTFPEKAIEVALRKPEERSEHDIRFIRSMMMGILSFRRYSTQMQHMLARVVYYRKFGRGRVIVRKGHRGDSFYFVFSGVIAITQDEDGTSALLDPEPILLHKGASFGEVALLKGLRRNATVVCMEDTEFLVVDRKEFFQNKLDQELQKELQYRFQFFRSLDLFSTWSDKSLETLADHCKAEECHHGQVIVEDTHETKNIIFVTKGRCEALRLVDLSRCPSFHKWIKQHEALLGRNSLLHQSGKAEANSSVNGTLSSTIKEATDILPERGSVYSVEDLARRYGLPVSYAEDPGNVNLPRELMAAVYLRIDSLQPGQYFRGVDVDYITSCFEKMGLKSPDQDLSFLPISDQKDLRSMVVISQGSEVIRIKLDKFSELADHATLKKLKERNIAYPSDNDLCRIFLEQNRWKVFKSDLVHQLSASPTFQPKHHHHQEKDGVGNKGQSADKRGILQLGTHKAKPEQFWTTPAKNKASECSKKETEDSVAEQTTIRLIHAIDIPKLCGKRIMW